jgi:hypothetical protein
MPAVSGRGGVEGAWPWIRFMTTDIDKALQCLYLAMDSSVADSVAALMRSLRAERDEAHAEIKRLRAVIMGVLGDGADESAWPSGTDYTVALVTEVTRLRSLVARYGLAAAKDNDPDYGF